MKKSTYYFILAAAILTWYTPASAQTETTDIGVIINDVIWAARNVGAPGTFAANPEDAGMFYQWNRSIGWSTTDPIINSDNDSIWNGLDVYIDNDGILNRPVVDDNTWEKVNDPCPSGWRLPTNTEFESLISFDNKWTTLNGVNGRIFSSDTNSLFLPAVGHRKWNGSLHSVNEFGYYFSSNIDNHYIDFLVFDSNLVLAKTFNYYMEGVSVRCVADNALKAKEKSSILEQKGKVKQ